jgi:uncharacterized protein with ParB-like and HNH nuclease domain
MRGNHNENFELLTLREIFDEGNRSFQVPSYQRGYSWEKQQRNDLLRDIEYVFGGEFRHFTGTIVASNSKEDTYNGITVYDIVDGQQRLTSLVILLATIKKVASENGVISNNIIEEIESTYLFSGRSTGKSIRKFKTGVDQDELFWQLVNHYHIGAKKIDNKSDQNLLDAFKEFNRWCNYKCNSLHEIYEVITKKLGFLFYAPQNDNEIGIMFEVINNRGKQLSELEKIKNFLIYFSDKNDVPDLKLTVSRSWGNILSNLNKCELTSNEQENSFLRNCWIVFEDTNKNRSYYVYENLKQKYLNQNCEVWKELQSFVEFIEKSSQIYVKLLRREGIENPDEICVLEHLDLQVGIASVIPLIISVYQRVTDQTNLINLIDIIEKLNFRFYATGIANRSDTGQGRLFYLSNIFFNNYGQEVDDKGIINDDWLYRKLQEFVDNNANDSKFIQYLTLDKDEAGDYYHWNNLKYFLANYEESLREKIGENISLKNILRKRDSRAPNNFFHREHIWASNDYTIIDDSDEKDVNKRRLGNFILLKETQNIKVSNKPIQEKINLYWKDRKNDPNTLMIRYLSTYFDEAIKFVEANQGRTRRTKNYWYEVYKKFFDIYEEKLVNFALKRWHISGLHKPIKNVTLNSFTDSNEIYTHSNIDVEEDHNEQITK